MGARSPAANAGLLNPTGCRLPPQSPAEGSLSQHRVVVGNPGESHLEHPRVAEQDLLRSFLASHFLSQLLPCRKAKYALRVFSAQAPCLLLSFCL